MPKLKFRDFKTRKSFTTDEFEIRTIKGGRRAAVAKAPSGTESFLFVKKDFGR